MIPPRRQGEAAGRSRRKKRRAPPKITPVHLERAALHYLERYPTSVANFRAFMGRKVARACAHHGTDPSAAMAQVDTLIASYIARGLLDDRAYAAARAYALFRRGASSRVIRSRLAAKGVCAGDIAAALEGLAREAAEPDYAAALAYARRRRLGPFRDQAGGQMRRQKDMAAMGRAGFGYNVARRVIDGDGTDDAE